MACLSPQSLSGSVYHTTSPRGNSVSFISLETKLSCFPSLCQMKLAIFTHEQHKKRKQNYRPSRGQILLSEKISDWVLFDFRRCQDSHCRSRFLHVHNVFVLCHFTLIFGIQVPCLNWNSFIKIHFNALKKTPCPSFSLNMCRNIFLDVHLWVMNERSKLLFFLTFWTFGCFQIIVSRVF